MPTEKTFYDRPDARELDARVVRVEARDGGTSALALDSTIFYPDGGGQPCDSGTIAGLVVRSVIEEGDDVLHLFDAGLGELKASGVVPGATVRCVVDLARRTDHSEQHTAQHLLSSVLLRIMGAATLSFHLGDRYSSIDIDLPPPGRADLDAVEDEVLRAIRDDYRVITHLCPPEDASTFPLRKEPSVEAGVLRVVEIDGLEYSACCGTHVLRTGALGSFRITKVEKYKAGCRVQFVAGGRAFADHRRLAGIARDSAAAAGVPEDELPGSVAAYKDRIKALERGLETARDAVAAAESSALDAAALAGSVVFAEAADVDTASRLGRALAKRGRVAVLACRSELKALACAPAAPAPGAAAADAVFGPIAAAHGGKGGGGKTFFQAAFPDEPALDRFISSARSA